MTYLAVSIGISTQHALDISAPYAMAARTSSSVSCGYSSNTSAVLMPLARKSSNNETQIRVPRIHGLPKHQLCELDRIAVLPEYRGKGVARQLFIALIKDAKQFYKKHKSKLRKLYLLTHADNIRAHKFYEKLGFKHETTLKQHYYKNKDEYVYSIFF